MQESPGHVERPSPAAGPSDPIGVEGVQPTVRVKPGSACYLFHSISNAVANAPPRRRGRTRQEAPRARGFGQFDST